jgi:murein DD-endopeptidase MepM/ murein hydrolase activator NlpD
MRGRAEFDVGVRTNGRRSAKRWARRPGVRFAAANVLSAAMISSAALALPAPVDAPPCLRPPVIGTIVDPFRAPACEWCAGNRGIEYRVGPDVAVRAAATGTVTFVGSVAGTTYLVVELPNGWRLTYGRLDDTRLRLGDPVAAGSVVGRVTGDFHFGLRIGDEYRDPALFIGQAVGRTRLIPLDGTPAPDRDPADVAVRTCPARVLDSGVVPTPALSRVS